MQTKNYKNILLLVVVMGFFGSQQAFADSFNLEYVIDTEGHPEFTIDSNGNFYNFFPSESKIKKIDSNGNFLLEFGGYCDLNLIQNCLDLDEKGSMQKGDGQFTDVFSMDVDSNDNLYILENSNHRIQKFDSQGNFLFKFGVLGNQDDQFQYPVDLEIDSLGNIWVLDEGNLQQGISQAIKIFDKDGNYLSQHVNGSTDRWLDDFEVGQNGSFFVYYLEKWMVKFASDESVEFTVGQKGYADNSKDDYFKPADFEIDSDGNIVVADEANHIFKIFDSHGNFLLKTDNLSSGYGLIPISSFELDPTGNIYIRDASHLKSQHLKLSLTLESTLNIAQIINTYSEDFTGFPTPPKVTQPKLDSKIELISTVYNPEEYAKTHGLEFKDGMVRLLLYVSNTSDPVFSKISQVAFIEEIIENKIQLLVNVNRINELNEISEVSRIRIPSNAIQSQRSMVSEGVYVMGADSVHQEGITGIGIKIAVLDLAFDTANSEIAENIKESTSFRNDFIGKKVPVSGSDYDNFHGTSVAEIIIDVAPDAELYLGTFGTELEFVKVTDWAVSKNVDIIAMSAGWVNYLTDGQSPMTKKVESVIGNDILFVISSGNYAENHWEGQFSDDNSNSWHEFNANDEGLSINVTPDMVGKQPLIFSLVWEEEGSRVIDFDLGLYNPHGVLVDYSSNVQNSKQDRREGVYFIPDVAGKYSLVVNHNDENIPKTTLEIFSPYTSLETFMKRGSVGVPNDAVGVISVGAVHFDRLTLEHYSSQGPTNSGNKVPVIVGPDAVTTKSHYDLESGWAFEGTSAAAPHIAGLAALILQKNPEANPAEIKSLLIENVDKNWGNSPGSWNEQVGYGLAKADFLVEEEDYFKQVTDWWAQNLFPDTEYANALRELIKIGRINVPVATSEEINVDVSIPDWFKQSAKWWVDGLTPGSAFEDAIENLIKQGIIVV